MKRSRLLIGIAIVCVAGIAVFQFVRHRGDKQPSGDAPSHEPRTHPQHKILQPTESPRPQPAGLHGTVIDAQGDPIANALVEAGVFEGNSPDSLNRKVFAVRTITDVKGEFLFPHRSAFALAGDLLASGQTNLVGGSTPFQASLVASKDGYVAVKCPVDFEFPNNPHQVMLKTSPVLTGTVVWKENQLPIPRVKVVCEPRRDLYYPAEVLGETDESGSFTLQVPAEGLARVSLRFYGDWAYLLVTLVPGKNISGIILEADLGSTSLIEGRVTNTAGEPVAEACVRLSTDKAVGYAVVSGKEGMYRLSVPTDWPYQSYFLEDWPDKPEIVVGGGWVRPTHWSDDRNWPSQWSPPLNAPPERLVVFHTDYEIAVVEVPLLGIGQYRQHVDVVLHRGPRVSGRVLDDNANILEGAKIEIRTDPEPGPVLIKNDNVLLRQREIVTDDAGGFEIPFLPAETYELMASYENCDSSTKLLRLGPDEVVEDFDFILQRRTAFIRGKVFDQFGRPWPHGTVKADSGPYFGAAAEYGSGAWSGKVVKRGRVAEIKEDGSYELTGLLPGKYNLWVDVSREFRRPEGILHVSSLRGVPTNTEGANMTVTELPAGALRVRVVDQGGQPVPEFRLTCCPLQLTYGANGISLEPVIDDAVTRRPSGGFLMRFKAGSNYALDSKYSGILLLSKDVVSDSGEFVVERVAPGSYFVSVNGKRHAEVFREVGVEPGRQGEAFFQLESLVTLEGVVVDPQGNALEGITVSAMRMKDVLNSTDRIRIGRDLFDWEDLYGRKKTKTRQDGSFILQDMEPTEYRVRATGPGQRSAFVDVTIEDKKTNFVQIVFAYGSSQIEGYIVEASGVATREAEVLLQGDGSSSRTRTDAEGHYRFIDLSAGKYLVKARIAGGGSQYYRGREVELTEGERARVDILGRGAGKIEGTISLGGEAARALSWLEAGSLSAVGPHFAGYEVKLVLREANNSMFSETVEMPVPADGAFTFAEIPAGDFDVFAYCVMRVSPEPIPIDLIASHLYVRPYYTKFVSNSETVRIASDSTSGIHLTIDRACTRHYPIPDPSTIEKWRRWY